MNKRIDPKLCIKCKGRLFCGLKECPIYSKANAIIKAKKIIKERIDKPKKDFDSSTPSVFVGHIGYPRINLALINLPFIEEKAEIYDSPKIWSLENYNAEKIISFRSLLINSKFSTNIKYTTNNRFVQTMQEAALSLKPIDLEVKLKNEPKFNITIKPDIAPSGPKAILKDVKLISNVKTNKTTDKVTSDTDLKANDAIKILYKKGFDEYYINKIFSVALLGVKKQRKFVPTRWAITAVDDIITKNIIKEIRDYKEGSYMFFFGGYLGNYYSILFIPSVWSYELFEMYLPKSGWNISNEINYVTDYESNFGRKNYAENTSGGYYATRLAIAEKLKNMKIRASALVIRVITPEYFIPLGVWVVREATRKALNNKPLTFDSLDKSLNYLKGFIKKQFSFDADYIIKNSKIINNTKKQTKLGIYK